MNVFLSRLLEHVPPPRLQTVRDAGLYANNSRAKLAVARVHFQQPGELPAAPKRLTWQERCQRSGNVSATVCPVCGAGLVSHSRFDSRGPPVRLLEKMAERRVAVRGSRIVFRRLRKRRAPADRAEVAADILFEPARRPAANPTSR